MAAEELAALTLHEAAHEAGDGGAREAVVCSVALLTCAMHFVRSPSDLWACARVSRAWRAAACDAAAALVAARCPAALAALGALRCARGSSAALALAVRLPALLAPRAPPAHALRDYALLVELTRGDRLGLEGAPAVCGALLPLVAALHHLGNVAAAVAAAGEPLAPAAALYMPRIACAHSGAVELAPPDVVPLRDGCVDADADARVLRVRVSVVRWSTGDVAPLWRELAPVAPLADEDAPRPFAPQLRGRGAALWLHATDADAGVARHGPLRRAAGFAADVLLPAHGAPPSARALHVQLRLFTTPARRDADAADVAAAHAAPERRRVVRVFAALGSSGAGDAAYAPKRLVTPEELLASFQGLDWEPLDGAAAADAPASDDDDAAAAARWPAHAAALAHLSAARRGSGATVRGAAAAWAARARESDAARHERLHGVAAPRSSAYDEYVLALQLHGRATDAPAFALAAPLGRCAAPMCAVLHAACCADAAPPPRRRVRVRCRAAGAATPPPADVRVRSGDGSEEGGVRVRAWLLRRRAACGSVHAAHWAHGPLPPLHRTTDAPRAAAPHDTIFSLNVRIETLCAHGALRAPTTALLPLPLARRLAAADEARASIVADDADAATAADEHDADQLVSVPALLTFGLNLRCADADDDDDDAEDQYTSSHVLEGAGDRDGSGLPAGNVYVILPGLDGSPPAPRAVFADAAARMDWVQLVAPGGRS